jgi:hypothetical protein
MLVFDENGSYLTVYKKQLPGSAKGTANMNYYEITSGSIKFFAEDGKFSYTRIVQVDKSGNKMVLFVNEYAGIEYKKISDSYDFTVYQSEIDEGVLRLASAAEELEKQKIAAGVADSTSEIRVLTDVPELIGFASADQDGFAIGLGITSINVHKPIVGENGGFLLPSGPCTIGYSTTAYYYKSYYDTYKTYDWGPVYGTVELTVKENTAYVILLTMTDMQVRAAITIGNLEYRVVAGTAK